jgi:hypothetical protein
LILATGAGAEMRRTLGTAVFSGMLGVTLFGIFLTPVFFYVIAGFVETPFFSSHRARHIGWVLRILLRVATLGVFWLPLVFGRWLGQPARARDRRPKDPAPTTANGGAHNAYQGMHAPRSTSPNGSNGHGKAESPVLSEPEA